MLFCTSGQTPFFFRERPHKGGGTKHPARIPSACCLQLAPRLNPLAFIKCERRRSCGKVFRAGGGARASHAEFPPDRGFLFAPRMSPLPRHSPIMRMRFTPHQMSGPFVQAAQERMSTPRMCSLCPHVSPCRTYPPFRMSKASAPPFRNRPAQKRESSAERAVRAMLFIARAVPLSSVPEIALPQNTHVPVRGRALSANATCRRTRSHSFPCATSSY